MGEHQTGCEQLPAWVSVGVDELLRLKVKSLVAENHILGDQIHGRPRLTTDQHITLAAIGKKPGREALDAVACIVTPETVLRWHREPAARKFGGRNSAKPILSADRRRMLPLSICFSAWLVRTSTWGYRRITGALIALDHVISHETIKNILEEHGIDPAPLRKGKTSWSDYIRSQTNCLLATDFFTTEVWTAFGVVTVRLPPSSTSAVARSISRASLAIPPILATGKPHGCSDEYFYLTDFGLVSRPPDKATRVGGENCDSIPVAQYDFT